MICVALPAAAARARAPAPVRPRAFAWLDPTASPAGWPVLVSPAARATLAYPPTFRPIGGDAGSVSAAVTAPPGPYIAYLNATRREGAERLHGFAAFRIGLLGEEHDGSVRLEAAGEQLAFRGATGSCVIDRYVTRVGHHHYREIACLVVGAHGGAAVVVAAALTSAWAQYDQQLMTAVRAFSVS
ncbi:MAG TPA: hypothetical protein VGU73_02365 [Acidimicrobiia bacterium]|nr:hypothetical protein [Acidimicrobiia bacterium]